MISHICISYIIASFFKDDLPSSVMTGIFLLQKTASVFVHTARKEDVGSCSEHVVDQRERNDP